ncbi:MAG: dihydroorotase [Armatimonadetes bacterium]|nr:dihydroorotase [Armatimonadota bacterium]
MDSLIIRTPDDFHVHLRDGGMLGAVAVFTARQFGRAIVMPNLEPPVITTEQALDYKSRIAAALPAGSAFVPLMTSYLTEDSDSDDIERGFVEGVLTACKLYPAGATTNSSRGVREIEKVYPVLAVMERIGMPLLIHGEVTDPEIDIFDREAVFIERILTKLIAAFPALKIVLEHITTSDGVGFIEASGGNIAATITPHHLEFNRNAMFQGGFRPHFYCLPIAKRESHRLAVRRAATSGSAKFFLGTDSAPHRQGAKESACGCAGVFNAPCALESYAKTFEEENALHHLEAFASVSGATFYGLPLNEGTITLERSGCDIPFTYGEGADAVVPFHAGETLAWKLIS